MMIVDCSAYGLGTGIKPKRKIPLDKLEANRKCAFGGGRDDCPCEGACEFIATTCATPSEGQS